MRMLTVAVSLLLAVPAAPAWNQHMAHQGPVLPVSLQQANPDGSAKESEPAAERQKRMKDEAVALSVLARQIHESLQKMQNGELSAVAIKQVREYVRLAEAMRQDASK